MSTETQIARVDLVAITSPGARALIWLYFTVNAALALWTLDGVYSPYPSIVALGAFAVVCVIFTVDSGTRLSAGSTWAVIALCVIATVLVIWQLESDVGYASWNLGAAGASLFFLALRGRTAASWLGFLLFALVIVFWGATTFHGLEVALLHISRQLPVLIIGTLFAIGIRRSAKQVERLSADITARALSESQQRAIDDEREQRLRALGELVTPLLKRLASGTPIGDGERGKFALAEAELRDELRGRALQPAEVRNAARAARLRGVDVVLLDDSDDSDYDDAVLTGVAARVVEALESATEGRLTVRLLPLGRESIATIVLDGPVHRSEVLRASDFAPTPGRELS